MPHRFLLLLPYIGAKITKIYFHELFLKKSVKSTFSLMNHTVRISISRNIFYLSFFCFFHTVILLLLVSWKIKPIKANLLAFVLNYTPNLFHTSMTKKWHLLENYHQSYYSKSYTLYRVCILTKKKFRRPSE